ncbi:hypothetical protein CALCODRAFT_486115 [Calocera cornea HHB12733]|uniref:Uncharacterized protein n=1 Tax=Calocera cornea HHB12733 TaxID=1353952 RepID=A0A165DXH4_9BASI|nr:hypothetical protein CALCODRAFT_486115 [Calocera cornea HHB12733]
MPRPLMYPRRLDGDDSHVKTSSRVFVVTRTGIVDVAAAFAALLLFISDGTTILGRTIANEYLALGTFFATGLGTWAAMRKPAAPVGPNGKVVKPEPKIEASSKEEEDFIKAFVAEAEKGDSGHH